MVLYIYSPDSRLPGNGVTFFEEFTSLRWRRKYFEPGEVELHVAPTPEHIALFVPGSIISRDDCPEAAEITGIELTQTDLKVTANMLSNRLGDIVIDHFDRKGSVSALMREAAALAGFTESAGSGGEEIAVQANFKNALAVVKSLAKSSGLGYRIVFRGPGDYLFEVYESTRTQDDAPMFSDEKRNLTGSKYTYSEKSYANTAVVAGQKKDGEAQTVVRVSGDIRDRVREIYVSASDVQRTDEMSDSEYETLLRQRGMEKLREHVCVENFESDVMLTPDDVYRVDWDLGDIATIIYEPWGTESELRITEVEEIYENGAMRVIPVFGDPSPEALDLGGD